MKNIVIFLFLFIFGISRTQVLTVRVIDIDNVVVPYVSIIIDNDSIFKSDCMGVGYISITPGVHNISISHPSIISTNKDIKITTNDTIVYYTVNTKWCDVKFNITSSLSNINNNIIIEVNNVIVNSSLDNDITVSLKPGYYTSYIYFGKDTIILPINVSNDMSIQYDIKQSDIKYTPPVIFKNNMLKFKMEEYPAHIYIYNFSGVLLHTQYVTSDNYSLDLPSGYYILIFKGLNNTIRSEKIFITE